jgi:hypothetical protein
MSYISDALTMDVIDECLHYLTAPFQLQHWCSLKPDGNIVMNEDKAIVAFLVCSIPEVACNDSRSNHRLN